jgi:hypothetical protein
MVNGARGAAVPNTNPASTVHGLPGDVKRVENGAKHAANTVSHDARTVKNSAEDLWNTVSHRATDEVHSLRDSQMENNLLNSSINQLHHKGDQTTLTLNASGKFALPLGAQAQGTDFITIKQIGQANSGYQVTLSETQQVGGNATVGREIGAKGTKLGYLSGEVNFGVTQTVTVTVHNKQDAERAAKTLARIMASNTVADTLTSGVGGMSQSPLNNPIMDSINGSGNPIQRGVQNFLSFTHLDPVSTSDRNFLKSHLTSYSTALTLDRNGQFSLGTLGIQQDMIPGFGSRIPLEVNGSGKLDHTLTFTRTITLASGSKPATVAYTLSDQLTASGSGGLKIALNNKMLEDEKAWTGKLTLTNLQGSADVVASVTATYNLGSPHDVSDPESSLTREGKWDKPNQVQSILQWQYGGGSAPTPGVGGGVYTPVNSGPLYTHTNTATVTNPASVGDPERVARFLLDGALGDRSAVRLVGRAAGTVTTTSTQATVNVNADRLSLDPKIDIGDVNVWLGLNANIATTTYPETPPTERGVDRGSPVAPLGQYVVIPTSGLNVRQRPSTNAPKQGAILTGSFVQAIGKPIVLNASGTWMYVTGTDMNDRPVKGWVEAQYIAPHPQGELAGTGRIDPTKRPPAYTPVVVQPGQSVWEIAAQYGVPVSALEDVNGQHIIDPSLIFPGDVVYVPTPEPQRGT